MEFPFTTNKQYLTREEDKRLKEFLALKVTTFDTWFNAAGESRVVGRIDLPMGCIIPETTYTNFLQDGSRRYATPCASVDGPAARITYIDAEKKWHVTDSDEWLAWVAGGYQIGEYKLPEKSEEEKKREALQVDMMKKVGTKGKDKFSSGATWTRKPGQK